MIAFSRCFFSVTLLAASVCAQGYSLNQFNQHATIASPQGAGIARFTLSAEAMRASLHADYADVGVFNAAGEPVPVSIIKAEPIAANVSASQVALVPISIQREGVSKPSLSDNIMKEIKLDGILIERVRGQSALRVTVAPQFSDAVPKGPSAKVWHFTALGDPEAAALFVFDIAPGERDFAVPIRVEGSDDLRKWSQLAEGTLYRVQVGEAVRESLRLPANGQRTRFVRVTASGENTLSVGALQGVLVQLPHSTEARPPSELLSVPLRAGSVAGEWVADLGGRFPLVGLQANLPQLNTIASTQWTTRASAAEPWAALATETLYRLLSKGVEIRNPELSARGALVREVRVQADMRGGGGLGAGALTLAARYHPIELLFAARGAGPFTLGVGLAAKDISAQGLPVASLVPGWSQKTRADVAVVSVEPLRANAKIEPISPPAAWRTLDQRKLILWSVLGLAVVVLGFMAYRLTRKVTPKERVGRS
jgi:Protein of unknown function (DUF3999)